MNSPFSTERLKSSTATKVPYFLLNRERQEMTLHKSPKFEQRAHLLESVFPPYWPEDGRRMPVHRPSISARQSSVNFMVLASGPVQRSTSRSSAWSSQGVAH